jgi:hypothetical protein
VRGIVDELNASEGVVHAEPNHFITSTGLTGVRHTRRSPTA